MCFSTPGIDSGIKYFISYVTAIGLLDLNIFVIKVAFRAEDTFYELFLSHDLHQNNISSLMNETYSNFFSDERHFLSIGANFHLLEQALSN